MQNLPFYRLFVADSRAPRDGRHIEQVGHYDPIPGAAMTWACMRCPLIADCQGSILQTFFVDDSTGKDGNKHVGLNLERIK